MESKVDASTKDMAGIESMAYLVVEISEHGAEGRCAHMHAVGYRSRLQLRAADKGDIIGRTSATGPRSARAD